LFHRLGRSENFRHITKASQAHFVIVLYDKDYDCWSAEKMSSNASGINMAVVFTPVGPVLRKTTKFDSVALKNNFLVCKEYLT